MAIISLSRRPRFALVAAFVASFVFLSLLFGGGEQIPERYRPNVDSMKQLWANRGTPEQLLHNFIPPNPLKHQTIDKATADRLAREQELGNPLKKVQFRNDAHTFASPDDFASHFEALAKADGISVTEAKRTCSWKKDDRDNLQFTWSEDRTWIAQGDVAMNETEARRAQWVDFYRTGLVPWATAKRKFKGRGIAIAAGNQNTLKRLSVLLRQLKRLGSRLPVEIHHWTALEIAPAERRRLTGEYHSVYFNDLAAKHNVYHTTDPPFLYGHFNLKTAALVNSRFEEILMLDSDIIPMVKPEELFETPTYKEFGTIFWPDLARTRPENPMWAITNTYCRMDEFEQESGQLMVDKRRFFYHLQLAAWFNEDQYYRDMLLGDKDMYRFAWHALRTKHGRPSRAVTSLGTLHEEGTIYCGHTYAQHHPDGSIAFLHQGGLKTLIPRVMKHFHENGGLYNAYKSSPHDKDWHWPEKTTYHFDGDSKIKDLMNWACMDLPYVQAEPVDKILPGLENFLDELGAFWEFQNLKPDEGYDHM